MAGNIIGPCLVTAPTQVCEDLSREVQAAQEYVRASKAPATLRAYSRDWEIFLQWCLERGLEPLPATPSTVAVFASAMAESGRRPSTIARRLAAIRYRHLERGLQVPTDADIVAKTVSGIRRVRGVRAEKRAPLALEVLRAMVDAMPDTVRARRDKALLLLGFGGAFRRSEVATLEVRDLEWAPEGVKVHLRRSKTNQEGREEVVPVIKGRSLCPVRSLKEWLAAANLVEGPIFRKIEKNGRVGQLAINDRHVARIVKWYMFRAGLDPTAYSAHSLRSGFLTAAAANRATLVAMQRVSRHRRVETLLGYVDQAEAFVDHAGDGLL